MNETRLIRLDALQNGVPVRAEIDGRAYVVCRVAGRCHVADDRCPHDDVALSLGSLDGHRLRCPLHGSEFDVRDGRVLSEPAEDDLVLHEVREEDGWLVLVDR